MDLISNVFYRTHFDVYPAGEDQNVFGEITKYIIGWCKYKAKLYGIPWIGIGGNLNNTVLSMAIG